MFIIAVLIGLYIFNHRQVNSSRPNNSLSPKQVANLFFDSLGKGDFNKAEAMLQGPVKDPKAADILKGLKVKNLGTPAENPLGPNRWFVPFEVQLKNGQIIKGRLSLRNDTPLEKWEIDGGI